MITFDDEYGADKLIRNKKKSPIFIAVTQQGEKKTEVKITYITKYNKID